MKCITKTFQHRGSCYVAVVFFTSHSLCQCLRLEGAMNGNQILLLCSMLWQKQAEMCKFSYFKVCVFFIDPFYSENHFCYEFISHWFIFSIRTVLTNHSRPFSVEWPPPALASVITGSVKVLQKSWVMLLSMFIYCKSELLMNNPSSANPETYDMRLHGSIEGILYLALKRGKTLRLDRNAHCSFKHCWVYFRFLKHAKTSIREGRLFCKQALKSSLKKLIFIHIIFLAFAPPLTCLFFLFCNLIRDFWIVLYFQSVFFFFFSTMALGPFFIIVSFAIISIQLFQYTSSHS